MILHQSTLREAGGLFAEREAEGCKRVRRFTASGAPQGGSGTPHPTRGWCRRSGLGEPCWAIAAASGGKVALRSGRFGAGAFSDKGFTTSSAVSLCSACPALCSIIPPVPAGLVLREPFRTGVHPTATQYVPGLALTDAIAGGSSLFSRKAQKSSVLGEPRPLVKTAVVSCIAGAKVAFIPRALAAKRAAGAGLSCSL